MNKNRIFIQYRSGKIIICTCLFSAWLSCKQQENKSIIPLPLQVTLKDTLSSAGLHTLQSLKQYLIDSVNCFAGSPANDTICRDENGRYYCVYTGMVNERRVAIIVIQDSAIFLIQERNGKCIVTDSSFFHDYALDFVPVRLNSDNQIDFLIESGWNMNGMKRSYMLIADSTGYLHLRFYPFYPNRNNINLWNIAYDSATNLVRKFYFGSAFGRDTKEIYQWNGDSLRLVRGAELDRSSGKYEKLNFYSVSHGKRFDYKTIRNPKNTLFDTAVWKDE